MNAKEYKIRKVVSIFLSFIAGGLFAYSGATDLFHSFLLRARGKTISAKVLDASEHISRRLRQHTYYLDVEFQPEKGVPLRRHLEVDRDVFVAGQAKHEVMIFYLLENPKVCSAGDSVSLRYGQLLFGCFLLGCGGYFLIFFQMPGDKKEAAASIEEQFKTLTLTHFEHCAVKASDFKHLDLDLYDKCRSHLEAAGYRFLEDIENVTLRKRTGTRTMQRVLLSGDGTIMAVFYHFRPSLGFRMIGAKAVKTLELETQFSDGTFVCTSNAEMAGKLDSPPSITALRLSAVTSWDMILEAHQNQLKKHLSGQQPERTPIKMTSLADVLRAQDDQQLIKSQFRKQTGLSKEELERIAGGKSKGLEELHEEVKKREKLSI